MSQPKCPQCENGHLVEREGKYGKFLGCNQYPTCNYIQRGDKPKAPAVDTGRKCPECNQHNLVEREGKYGKFIACSGYPKCTYIEKGNFKSKGSGQGFKNPTKKDYKPNNQRQQQNQPRQNDVDSIDGLFY